MGQSSTSVPVGSSRLHSLQIVRDECACTNLWSSTKRSSSASVHFGEAENTLWGPQQDKVCCISNLHPILTYTYEATTLPGTGLTPAELDSSDGQSANVGAAGPCRLHWRYVTTQLSSLVRDCSKPLQTRSQARTSTVMLQATGQGWCSPACRPTHPGPLCSEIMVLTL